MIKKFALIIILTLPFGRLMAQNQPGEEDYAKGLQLYFEGYYQLAATSFGNAIKTNPKLYEAYLYQGNCYANLHQFNAAEKDLKIAAKHLKKNQKLEFAFGYLYNEMGNYKNAIPHLEKAVLLDPKDALAFNALGVSCQGLHRARTAIDTRSE